MLIVVICVTDVNSDIRPASMSITLTVTVTNTATDGSIAFTLYKYDSLAKVPESNFNKNAANASNKWNIVIEKGKTHVLIETIKSSDIAVYRCVKSA